MAANAASPAWNGSRPNTSRAILVLGPPGTVSQNLVHALEHEFPGTRVEHRAEAAAACTQEPYPVPLILVDPGVLPAAEAVAPLILARHPRAVVALIDRGARETTADASTMMSTWRLVRSILPMNVSLDIWLSVIRLMLSGGDYMPPELLRQRSEAGRETSPASAAGTVSLRPRDPLLASLTVRELQILEMVSRGLQNKSIAAGLTLSESTVKIHLHNIIAKLHVHNRTEAAARYRDGLASQAPA